MAGKPDIYDSLAAFRYALRQFLAFSESVTRQAGVTPQQYQAMLVIRTWPGEAATIKDLADQLILQHNAAVQLVNRLAKAGLAERQPSSADRRSVLLKLTRRGEQLLEELASHHLNELLRHEPLLAESLSRLRKMGT
jgi:DNA-binding MarR family transcriptional regulator